MNQLNRIKVYEDTKRKCLDGTYGKLIKGISYLMKNSNSRLDSVLLKRKYDKMCVEVVNDDVLVVANRLHTDGEKNILVLNMASNYRAGGGVERGAMAQEEELFRRSNYFMSLDNTFYPLEPASVVYTPNVSIVKDRHYRDLSAPHLSVSMLAVAAIRNPKLTRKGEYSESDYKIMFDTIHNIFKVSYMMNHETLILGALGCGAFHNPPVEVIKIYNIFLEKYSGCFKNVIFAVYSREDDNFAYFSKYIKG